MKENTVFSTLGSSQTLSHFSHAQIAFICAKEEHIFFLSQQQDAPGLLLHPGIMALEEAAREVRQGYSFCRATNTLLSFSVCLNYESTSACPWGVQMKLQGCSLAPAV